MHADIIDRLDFSGVGAASRFAVVQALHLGSSFTVLHHDGPFDACAPSRNKHKHKAPMMAWGQGDIVDEPLANVPDFSSDRRLSPLAQSTLTAMNSYDSPYQSANFYPGSPGAPGSIPKKRVDALAEAWGMAEPEPFEEFFAGGGDRSANSSIKNGKEGHTTRRSKDARDAYRDYLEDGSRPSRAQRTRSIIPPPKPLFLPGSRPDAPTSPLASVPSVSDPQLYPTSGEGSPRRSKSLMQRIRKMRDAPNVPVSYDEESEPSDSPPESLESDNASAPALAAGRPTHKHRNSFLGRFARSTGGTNTGATVPDPSNDFGSVDDNGSTKDKDLPAPPADYLGDVTPNRGLGRKTSLMKKVVKGVRGRSK